MKFETNDRNPLYSNALNFRDLCLSVPLQFMLISVNDGIQCYYEFQTAPTIKNDRLVSSVLRGNSKSSEINLSELGIARIDGFEWSKFNFCISDDSGSRIELLKWLDGDGRNIPARMTIIYQLKHKYPGEVIDNQRTFTDNVNMLVNRCKSFFRLHLNKNVKAKS